MKLNTLRGQVIILSASLMLLTALISYFEHIQAERLRSAIKNTNETQLPSLRAAAKMDMYHDGLRSYVYQALYKGDSSNLQEKKEIAESLAEMQKDMVDLVADLKSHELNSKTTRLLSEAEPAIDSYLKAGEEVIGRSLAGQKLAATEKLPEFNQKFSELEEKLELLVDSIEEYVNENQKLSQAEDVKMARFTNGFLAFGLLFGLGLSIWILNNVMKTFSQVFSNLSNSSLEVSNAAEVSASGASKLSKSAEEQAASLQETMASAEEISAMALQNSDSAKKVNGLVETNLDNTNNGTRSVSEMLVAIGEIKTTNDEILNQMQNSNREFLEIVKIISEIGDKTKVINDIVFQTKLLSFNASVEAARAGEHGKGFAVVAEEVGNLAQMSGNAAKQITDMLSDSTKKVNDIVNATTHKVDQLIEIGRDKIATGQSTADRCREALSLIADNATKTVDMIHEITHASQEQAQGVSEINKAITQLDQSTQLNNTLAQQSSTQADSLKAQAQNLITALKTLSDYAGIPTNQTPRPPDLDFHSSDRVLHKIDFGDSSRRNTKNAAGAEFTPFKSRK